jgi:hypothetical protein
LPTSVGRKVAKRVREKQAASTPTMKDTELFLTYRISVQTGGVGVEIEGLSPGDAQEALMLLQAARRLQYSHGTSAARGLLRTVTEANLELTPPASVEHARRLADLRQALLATPVYTHETLAEVRGDASTSSTRTWVSRARDRGQLFTVKVDGRTVIPAFQLSDEGEPRSEYASVLAPLLEARIDGWTLWTWLTSSTPLLSGAVPVEVVDSAPERVLQAAKRFASARRSAA